MKEALIDKYHLQICPSVLGKGKPLFAADMKKDMELFETKVYESGVMFLSYKMVAKNE